MTTVIREDLENEFVWARIEETHVGEPQEPIYYYSTSQSLLQSRQVNDDGVVVTRDYALPGDPYHSNYVERVVVSDALDDHEWTSIEVEGRTDPDFLTTFTYLTINYDDGVVERRYLDIPESLGLVSELDYIFLTYDDYRIVVEGYLGTESILVDGSVDGGDHDWTQIHYVENLPFGGSAFYEGNGEETTLFDNGVERVVELRDGVPSIARWVDPETDAAPNGEEAWSQRYQSFSLDGSLAAEYTLFDDGFYTLEGRHEGGVSYKIEYDHPDASSLFDEEFFPGRPTFSADGEYSWQTRITFSSDDSAYQDVVTTYEDVITTFDDGVVDSKYSRNGLLHERMQEDNPDAEGDGVKPWDTIVSLYDENGKLDSKRTEYDDGRVTTIWYEDGVRAGRTDTDTGSNFGKGVKPWRQIDTTYDAEGQIEGKATLRRWIRDAD